MRRFYYNVCFYTLVGLVLTSCSDGNYWDNSELFPSLVSRYLNISVGKISLEASASSGKADVQSVNVPWCITGMDSTWLKVTPTEGDSDASIIFRAQENTSGDDSRTSILSFASLSPDFVYQKQLSVTQSFASPYLTPEKTSLSISGAETTIQIPVKSNIIWEASCQQQWVELTSAEDGSAIKVKVSANDSGASRSASIVLKGKVERTIALSQAMANIYVSSSATLHYDKDGGTYEIQFDAEAPWRVESSDAWLKVSPSEGSSGKSLIQVSATPNEAAGNRTGYIYFKIGGKSIIELKIAQEGCYIEAQSTTLTFDSNESSQQLQVNSNIAWEILECPDWVTPSSRVGEGNQQISLSVKDNPNTTSRSGLVKIGKRNTTIVTEVDVTQSGKTFGNVVSKLSFDDLAETLEVNIQTNGQWTANSEGSDWITVSPTSGTGNAKIKISVTENTGTSTRVGSVGITVGNTTKRITIEQNGKFFVIDTSNIPTIPATGGSHSIGFSTNESWVASTKSSWVTLSPKSGHGDATIQIIAADNPSIYTRTDTTIITPTVSKPVMVITKQEARYLRVNVSTLSFFGKGGTSNAVTIDTNGTFMLTSDQSWITINQYGKTFSVTVPQNSAGSRREGKVSVSLTGLTNGETCVVDIPVIQSDEVTKIVTITFPQDEDWNLK